MVILDTNVLSGVISTIKDLPVVAWLNGQAREQIWITSITVFEVRMGIERLAQGRRRNQLEAEFEEALSGYLQGRVFPFDAAAARQAGTVYCQRLSFGRPMDIRDAQIAGIALATNATLATRNIRDFENLGITLVDPWRT